MAPRKDTEATIDCVVLRDFWVTADDRKRAGTIVALSLDEALDKIESGIVMRHRPKAE